MAKNKTIETSGSVNDFLNAINDETKRNDSYRLIDLIYNKIQTDPKMWGPGIIGFGCYHYRYESGREGDSPLFAFSPRVSAITLYLSGHFEKRDELLGKLGKFKTDKCCIHIKRLDDISIEVLENMIINHIDHIREMYPPM